VPDAVRDYLNSLPPFPPAVSVEFFSRNLVVVIRDHCGDVDEGTLFDRLAPHFQTLYPVAVTGLREQSALRSRISQAADATFHWNEHLDKDNIAIARGFLHASLPIRAMRTLQDLPGPVPG
jgi:hypothetical protein